MSANPEMKTRFHIDITRNALEDHFSSNALQKIVRANILQDRIKFQFGHDFIHFDSSAFSESLEYIDKQKEQLIKSIVEEKLQQAWASLGRILHGWQDFYSHSNYVDLWLKKTKNPQSTEINHNDQEILNSPMLVSGKNYGLIEFIAMLPGLSKLIKPLMPRDSHAVMNLDSPKSGPNFHYAFEAAEQRTEDVILRLLDQFKAQQIDEEKINAFLGK